MSFRAAVLHEIGKPLTIETVESTPLAPDDVRVRVRAASICHTDLDVVEGEIAYPLPMVLGHEAAGSIAEVGLAVKDLKPGDAVVLSWNPYCGHCFYCRRGQPILCEPYVRGRLQGLHFDGGRRLSLDGKPLYLLMYLGAFAEHCIVPAQSAIKVPDEIPFDRACLIGCGVMTGVGGATHIARVTWGSTVMVIGCGAIGLAAVQGARFAGATNVVAVDLAAAKLEIARALGATHVCDARKEDPVAAVKALTGGRGADYVIEGAGSKQAFQLSVEAVRPGGQVVWLGKVNVKEEVSFRWGSLMGERRIVRSSYGGARPQEDFPNLARAYLEGKLKLDELITQRIKLEDINDGFAALKRGEAIRTVIEFPD